MSTIESDISALFANNLFNMVEGISHIFLVELDTGDVTVSFPESQDSKLNEFIAEIAGTTTSSIEEKSKAIRKQSSTLSLTSMELRTEDGRRIATYRITNSLLICLVGKEDTFKPAFAKRLCEGPVKDQVNELLIKYNIAG
jgi:hypothetical protein